MDKNILEAYNTLLEKFGRQGWWPVTDKKNARFEVIAGAILTQNTAWKNVERAIAKLRENKLLSRKAILSVDTNKLARLIKSSGYHNQKARKLKEFARFNKKATRENLLGVWGIGKETADSILLYAYGKPYFVVDNYTRRIFQRVGYKQDSYEELQKLFVTNLPKDIRVYKEYHALIVELGKNYCRKKPECGNCVLKRRCRHYEEGGM